MSSNWIGYYHVMVSFWTVAPAGGTFTFRAMETSQAIRKFDEIKT